MVMLPPFQSSVASSPLRPPPSLHASTAPPPSLSASTAPRNDPSDPTHNNHQTRDPNPDAPKPASNLNKPTTTTPSATSCVEQNVGDQIPRDGMIFDSEEKLRTFYNKYGHEVGFGVRQSSTLTRGKLKYFALGCSKGGTYTPKEGSSKLKLSSKTGCEAKIFVSVRSSGRNFHSLVVEARGYENLQFDERDCRNYIAKVRQLRLGVGDAETLHNYFLRMQRRNSNFFYVIDMDDDGRLRNVFWKENKADFDSSNSSYQLITSRFFEKQLQEAYTNAIFKLFQDELRGMLYCNLSLHKVDGPISIFHVNDVVEGKDGHHRKRFVYTVQYDDVKCDVKCSCRYFEFKGILCRHITKILTENDVKEIPSCYILNRWRKNIRHSHYYVQNCYDDWETSEQAIQIDKLCANFFEAAYMVNSKEKCDFLMKWVNEAKEKLKDTLSWDDSSQASCVAHAPNPSAKLLPPLQVRSKGRPPSKRKESKVEKIIKTRKKKKDT
ncbi:hypothetical protein OROHE_000776 [Orobanche hederae]